MSALALSHGSLVQQIEVHRVIGPGLLEPVYEVALCKELWLVDKLISIHTAQLLTYLRLQNLWLGLLINFNVNSLRDGLRRVLTG
ncbi:MAG: GxxExxY protein [Gemmatimonadales bacterium]|nr:GxxExxY protein [Gemmatimonadales bacterium]